MRAVDEVRLVGRNEQAQMDLYLSVVQDFKKWSPDLSRLRPFVAVLALDAEQEEDETLERLASHLIAAGCQYVCTWGPGCVWLHHVTDDVWIRENPQAALLGRSWRPWEWTRGRREARRRAVNDAYVDTTAHEDDTLDEALWFAVFNTYAEGHDLWRASSRSFRPGTQSMWSADSQTLPVSIGTWLTRDDESNHRARVASARGARIDSRPRWVPMFLE